VAKVKTDIQAVYDATYGTASRNSSPQAGFEKIDVHFAGQKIGKGLLIDGTTYYPLRPLVEKFGYTVNWDGVKREIYIVKPNN